MTKLEETGSGKSKMVASKLEILLSIALTPISNEVRTATAMFVWSSYSVRLLSKMYDRTGTNRKCKSKMAACKVEVPLSQRVHKTATDFQHIQAYL